MVNDFLDTAFSPERKDLIINAIDAMIEFNLVELPNELELIVLDAETDTATKIMRANQAVIDGLLQILNLHSIIVLDLTRDLKLLTDMVRSLTMITSEYDPDFILSNTNFVLDDANEAADVWVSLVTLLTDSDEHDVYSSVFLIEDSIIHNIEQALRSKVIELPPDDNNEYITNYRKFLNGRRVGLIYDLVRGGVTLGDLEYNHLFCLLEDELYKLKEDELIFEVISLILISDITDTTYIELIDKSSRLFTTTDTEAKHLNSKITQVWLSSMGTLS